MSNEFEVITSFDKDARDTMYMQLRASSDPLERQVVKFSGNEQVPAPGGGQVWVSTWSLAYPRS